MRCCSLTFTMVVKSNYSDMLFECTPTGVASEKIVTSMKLEYHN